MARKRETGTEQKISPYEIMIILDPDVDEERQQEMLERVQTIIRDGGGEIDHVNDWGRRKLSYAMEKKADGRYVILTCSAGVDALGEAERVMSINKDVVIRFMTVVLNRAEAERAKANGAPLPVDDRPEGEARPARAGRGGARRRPR
jgi:small subunit ribosomal protein S6